MNWVGGARNRLRGSLHTEHKIQKEFFERKRLNSCSTTVRRETTSKKSSEEPKRKKHGQSQDVLSLKRQCKVVGRNGLQASSRQSYKIINLGSRTVGPRKNANANVAWNKRIENVELPISPIETPSALRLSLSPASKHENTGNAPRVPDRESTKENGQQNRGTVASFLFHTKGKHQDSMTHINLFGSPHDRPVKITQPSHSKSSFAINSSRVERKEPHDPVRTDGNLPMFADFTASERHQPHSWPNMDFHKRNLMVSEDFQTTPACSNCYDPRDLTNGTGFCSGPSESRSQGSLGFVKNPLTDNLYRFNHGEIPQLPRLGYNQYNNILYSSTASDSNVNYASEVFDSTSSNADSFEVSVVNSPPCRKKSSTSLYIDMNEISQDHSPNCSANSIFAEKPVVFDKVGDGLAVSDFAQGVDTADMYPILGNAQYKKGSHLRSQLRRDQFHANERKDLAGRQFEVSEQVTDLSSQMIRCRQGQVNIRIRNADVHGDGKSRQDAGFQYRDAVSENAGTYIVSSGLDFTPDKDQPYGTVLCQGSVMLERAKKASNVVVKDSVPQRTSSSSAPTNSSHPEEDPTVFRSRIYTDRGTQVSATILRDGSLNTHLLPTCHALCVCSESNAEPLSDARNPMIQQSMIQEKNSIHISSGHGSRQIIGCNSSTRHCPDSLTNFKQQFEEKTPRSRVSQVPAHSTVGVTVESPRVEMAESCTYEVLTHSVESTSGAEYQHPATTSSDTTGEKNRSSPSQNCVTAKDSTTTSMRLPAINGPAFESTRSSSDNDGRAGSSATSVISQAPKEMDNDDGVTSSDIGPNADHSQGNRRPVSIRCDEGKTDNPDRDKGGQCIGLVHLVTEMNNYDSQVCQGTQTTPKQLLFRNAACSPIWTFNGQDASQFPNVTAIATAKFIV